MFDKNESFEVSKKFFESLEEKVNKLNPTFKGYYNLFTNCREQGLQLIVYGNNNINDGLCIWSCRCRNSDQIMVVIGERSCSSINNTFDNKAYSNAKYFERDDYDSATEYALNVIKKVFSQHLSQTYNYKFNCNKGLFDLQKIIDDAKDLEYDDYYDLATFEENNMLCDLIILNGEVGLRYSKYLDDEHTELENMTFEKFVPDLTSDITLMLGMKQKLNDFIDKEIEYNIEIGI